MEIQRAIKTYRNRPDCDNLGKHNRMMQEKVPNHQRVLDKCRPLQLTYTNDQISQTNEPTADELCTQWFVRPAPMFATETAIENMTSYPNLNAK